MSSLPSRLLDSVVPGLTFAQLGFAVLHLVALALLQLGLNRLQKRWTRLNAAYTGAPRRFYAVLLSIYPRLSVWMWIVGIYKLFAWHLGSVFGIAQTEQEILWGQHFLAAVTLVIALSLVGRLLWVTNQRLRHYAAGGGARWQSLLAVFIAELLQIGVPLFALHLVVPLLQFSFAWQVGLQRVTNVCFIAAAGWVLARMVNLLTDRVIAQHDAMPPEDSFRTRPVVTQVALLRKVALVGIAFVTLASCLVLFDQVRQFGASLLASAGVIGIIVGVAAQRTLTNLFAGFQIALTQPILLEDAVLVEGEYGDVEEITLTYVVVRLWDQRRLVLPISYFLEKPFQNWSRRSREITGGVFLLVDYAVPLDALRAEFERILETESLWNRKVKKMQVTEARAAALEIRFLMTADTPSRAFDLRCEVREALVKFLREHYPQSLPARVYTEAGSVALSASADGNIPAHQRSA